MILALDSPDAAFRWCNQQRKDNQRLGFVATMGALHQGHLSLISRSVRENDVTCASIFVNPLQFNSPHDLEKYPNNPNKDINILAQAGCNMVYTGSLEQFFPEVDNINHIKPEDPGQSAKGLEEKYRPGHLQGVATIVKRLFETTGSCNAYFGEKDFQQTLVVKYLARSLKRQALDINVIACPTIRETSGLALSSRNRRLTPSLRKIALNIYRALCLAKEGWSSGAHDPAELERIMLTQLEHPAILVDYASLRDQENWTTSTPDRIISTPRALIAAYVGEVRLIDNLQLLSQ